MTAATPITTPRSVSTLRNLCAHKLEVAIATASEKFIDRFAVVPDEDRFAVVSDKDRFVDELDSMFFVGRELDARSGWSMNKAMRECPHPNIRKGKLRNYEWVANGNKTSKRQTKRGRSQAPSFGNKHLGRAV